MYRQVYYERLDASGISNSMSQRDSFFAHKVVVNGIIFSRELWLPNFIDNQHTHIMEIVDIFLTDSKDIDSIFAVCKVYNNVEFDDHFGCYFVQLESLQNKMTIININDYISRHHYPVKIHQIGSKHLFRCKRF